MTLLRRLRVLARHPELLSSAAVPAAWKSDFELDAQALLGQLRGDAKRVFAFATHGLLNGPAAERIEACALEEVVLANTLPLPPNVQKTTRKVRQLSVGKLLAQVIMCIHTGDSVHNLFDVKKGGSLLA